MLGMLGTPLVRHFQIYAIEHSTITGLQAYATWTGGQQKRQERNWINRIRTQVPLGLNLGFKVFRKIYWFMHL